MSRPQIVNLTLEDLGTDALPIEKYIDALEAERDKAFEKGKQAFGFQQRAEKEAAELRLERDTLAAHIERYRSAYVKLTNTSVVNDDWERLLPSALLDEFDRIDDDSPTTSLARRDADSNLYRRERRHDDLSPHVERLHRAATSFAQLQEERDALVAHVDRLHRAAEACVQVHEEGFSPTPDELRELNDALDARFSQSLACRDARVKAEALHELLMFPRMGGEPVRAKAVKLRDGYRQQAEGGGDE